MEKGEPKMNDTLRSVLGFAFMFLCIIGMSQVDVLLDEIQLRNTDDSFVVYIGESFGDYIFNGVQKNYRDQDQAIITYQVFN